MRKHTIFFTDTHQNFTDKIFLRTPCPFYGHQNGQFTDQKRSTRPLLDLKFFLLVRLARKLAINFYFPGDNFMMDAREGSQQVIGKLRALSTQQKRNKYATCVCFFCNVIYNFFEFLHMFLHTSQSLYFICILHDEKKKRGLNGQFSTPINKKGQKKKINFVTSVEIANTNQTQSLQADA